MRRVRYFYFICTLLLFLMSIGLVLAGSFVERLNEHKLTDAHKSALRDELILKLKSGEIQANNDLLLRFVKSNHEIESTTNQFLNSVLHVIQWTGYTMVSLLVLQVVFVIWFVRQRKVRGETQSIKAE